ncbi:hypothetical protein PYJP_15130 [Pyrofollis japonicus]|uniref:polyprenyl synthetase family protein n=1 Tax=Pyrofollis japonicus TaxID=3060460 RepID=UPI00295AA0FA|nr:polyprenyl synthetase family protein [Pyrofollis japonicus]BEP18161.1 hypothetical protein PYJP_15130 [Pyrofollis japonicus]
MANETMTDLSIYTELLERWKSIKSLIDTAIENRLRELPQAQAINVAHYIAMGGKRLRGFLVIELAKTLGASIKDALDAAVAVELVHAASLALDDIIDEDTRRRGKEAAWIKHGLKKTVMVSNLLIPFAQEIIYQKYGALALLRTVAAWLDISKGEVIDAFYTEPLRPETYIEMVRLKTGSLFRLSAELGAIAAKAYDLLDSLSTIGENIGIMYQIADDIRDSMDPEKSTEPGLRLFRAWINGKGIAKAYLTINKLLEETNTLINKTFGTKSTLIHIIPSFIVSAMLGELDTKSILRKLN